MAKVFRLFICIFLVACSPKNKVYLIKQWHLAPGENSTDLLKAKTYPQFASQLEIYKKSFELIKSEKSKTIIAEGCEGKIDKDFSLKFNGWTMADIIQRKDLSDFEDILAPVPMKLKAQFGEKLNVICGDDPKMIQEHNLAFSDLKAFSGFFQRLNYYFQNDEKAYQKYLKAFKNVVTLNQDDDPVEVAKNKTLESLNKFENFLMSRNYKFTKTIIDNIKDNPILIIGGLHIPGIEKILTENKIDYEVITPSDYPGDDYSLFVKIREAISSYKSEKVTLYNQVPEGFDPSKFPIRNVLDLKKLSDKKEWDEIVRLSKIYRFDPKLLQSDYDKDGIRDFTISKAPNGVIISAEDNDWDNDGILNLIDESIGKESLYKVSLLKSPMANTYQAQKINEKEIFNYFESLGIKLLESRGERHELLVLKILMEVMKKTKFDKKNLDIIHATKPQFSYGKQVFFSYISTSKSIEIYPERLFQYIDYKKKNDFKGADEQAFINGFFTPLLIHSLAHELSHTINYDIYTLAKNNRWTWEEDKSESLYLKSFRNKDKKIHNYYNFKYEDKTYSQWLELHQVYIQTTNEYLHKYPNEKDFLEKVKELKWYVKSESKKKEFQLSFLVSQGIPSLYSLQKPDEWVTEIMASCVFLKFYPVAKTALESIRLDLTIGLNPSVATEEFCKYF